MVCDLSRYPIRGVEFGSRVGAPRGSRRRIDGTRGSRRWIGGA